MKNNKINKKIFWITGLSGSGKSAIGKKILPKIKQKYGNTILINGDDIRNIFNIKTYDKSFRVKIGKSYFNLCMFLLKQDFNVIFTTVGLWHDLHKYNKLKGKNRYIEIFIDADIKKLVKRKSKFFPTKSFSFLLFSVDFGGATEFVISKSSSMSNFASDRPIHSSVRPLERLVGQSESRKGGLAGD